MINWHCWGCKTMQNLFMFVIYNFSWKHFARETFMFDDDCVMCWWCGDGDVFMENWKQTIEREIFEIFSLIDWNVNFKFLNFLLTYTCSWSCVFSLSEERMNKKGFYWANFFILDLTLRELCSHYEFWKVTPHTYVTQLYLWYIFVPTPKLFVDCWREKFFMHNTTQQRTHL